MSRVDGVRGVDQAAGGGLLEESVEDIVNDVFEISEKPINSVSRRGVVESAVVPDKAMLEFSCDWASAVDVLVVAVQKAAKEVWWFANTSYSSKSSKSRYSNSGTVSVAAAFKNSLTEASFYRDLEFVDTVSKPCCFARDSFYDRLTK